MSCPVCKSNQLHSSFTDPESGVNIHVCGECYMVYQPKVAGIDYYDIECGTTRVLDLKKHAKDVANYILDFCKPSKDIKSILEIGASSTHTLNNLKKYFRKPDIKLCGLDLPVSAGVWEGNLDSIKMVYSTCIDEKTTGDNKSKCLRELTSVPFGETFKYDFIYCRHTLEHFQNPKEAVENTHNLLSFNGTAFFEVPSFLWTEVNNVPTYDLEHLSYFTKPTLIKIFSDAGFKVLKIKESKYWGNIKILVRKLKKSENKEPYTVKNLFAWKWLYLKIQPLFIAIKNNMKIGPNS
tara:strand:+ start:961 stop:1842 length:882 start_codon:yes stop_codon:yes gene_type:complete